MNTTTQTLGIIRITLCLVLGLLVASVSQSFATEKQSVAKTLITNVRIFDGQNEKLAEGRSVLVEGNKITQIAKAIDAPAGAIKIDAGGRVLMPGLIDAHWHSMFNFWPVSKVLNSDFGYLSIAAVKPANETLLRGFTTVRDVGGNCFPISKATDEGLIDAPQIMRP